MAEHSWSPMVDPDPDAGSWDGLRAAERRDAATWVRWAEVCAGDIGSWSDERAFHSWLKSDQSAPSAPSPAPDPFTGDQHAMTARRSRSGRTMKRVTRAGRVYVTGPDPITGRDMLRADSVTLQHLADALFPDIPPVLGTDLRAFAQVIDAGHGAADVYGVARHRADITDGMSGLPRSIAREVRLQAVYGSETNDHGEYVAGGHRTAAELARRPERFSTRRTMVRRTDGRIGSHTMARRANDPGTDVRDADGKLMFRAVIDGKVTRIVSWHDDPALVWVGHECRERPRVKSSSVARTERRSGRGVRATREVTPEESAIADALADGADEVSVTFPDVTLTIVRHAASPMSVTMVRGSERVTFRARTAAVIARRVTA